MTHLILQVEGAVASIVFNRAEKRNAFNLSMFEQLAVLLDEVENKPEVRAVVLRGVDERAFSAGADISEFTDNRASKDAAKTYNDKALQAVDRLQALRKPTIAMIQGLAIGGGLDLALACDFRFSAFGCRFAITPSKLGIVYNLSSTKRLTDVVGPARAKDILYTGRILDSEEAYRIGLVDRLIPAEDLHAEVYAYAALLAERSQVSILGTKDVITAILQGETSESPAIADLVLRSYESDDYREGVSAFMEKRKPDFMASGLGERVKGDTQ